MSVKKRVTSKGESEFYHYKFMFGGKYYTGVCKGCTKKKDALLYEQEIKNKVIELSKQKSVKALIENFKQELTGGNKISLTDAFDLYTSKPRRRQPSLQQQKINLSQWLDFLAFMADQYPDILHLDKVTRTHTEPYIQQLRKKGRFVSKIVYQRNYKGKNVEHSYNAQPQLSGRTINAFHKTLKSVFSRLKEDAGIIYNPFEFDMMNNDSESREAFTVKELKIISENLNEFVKPIFIIGICTGLSEGDICTLRWDEIRDERWIVRKRRKTGTPLEIPILPPLARFLNEQKSLSSDGEYVLVAHATMYKKKPSGISYRFKKFLEELGIKTTRLIKGRSRAASVKDIHSLRHTFAYMAGCYKIPLPVVQSILGHMSPEMTKHYQAHADRKDKEKYLSQMPDFLSHANLQMGLPQTDVKEALQELPTDPERIQLHQLIDEVPLEAVQELLKQLQNKQESMPNEVKKVHQNNLIPPAWYH